MLISSYLQYPTPSKSSCINSIVQTVLCWKKTG